jgi:hypothetical protein
MDAGGWVSQKALNLNQAKSSICLIFAQGKINKVKPLPFLTGHYNNKTSKPLAFFVTNDKIWQRAKFDTFRWGWHTVCLWCQIDRSCAILTRTWAPFSHPFAQAVQFSSCFDQNCISSAPRKYGTVFANYPPHKIYVIPFTFISE